MNDKDLLIVSNHYLTFVKDQSEAICTHFKNINVLVRFHRYYSFSPERLMDLKDMSPNIKCIKIPLMYIPTDSNYKLLGDKHFNVVDQVIQKNNLKFDLIHSHFAWSSGYVGAKLKEKYNIPFVVTAHGYDIYDLPFRDDEWKSRIDYVLNSADAIITVSRSNFECIKKLDVKTPVTVIPNGYREDLFHPIDIYESRRSLNLPFNKKVILSVGNLEEIKGHKYLIEAMANVIKKRKDVICFIVGGGKLKGKLSNQIISAGLQNHVKLVGGKPHNEIPLWMNACDVFVLPSIRESFGVVQIEAMACGKPVVATRNGGSEEIIVSRDYGLICDPARPKELAESILLSLDMSWDSKKIVSYASQFSLSVIGDLILDIYNSVLSN